MVSFSRTRERSIRAWRSGKEFRYFAENVRVYLVQSFASQITHHEFIAARVRHRTGR